MGGGPCQNEKWETHASEIGTNNMWKHLRGLKLLKWQIYWEQKEQYVMEEMKGKGDRKHSPAFSILRFKTKQNKIQEELEGSQPNAVIS